jgi:hypothetical protein
MFPFNCHQDRLETQRRAPGRPRFGGVTNSDDWFSKDGNDGVGRSLSSFVPSRRAKKTIYITMNYRMSLDSPPPANALKICDSLNSCAAHKN